MLIHGVRPLALVLLFVGLSAPLGAPGSGLAVGRVAGGLWALLVLLASSAQFVLTPEGIRVRFGHLGMWTSVTTVDQIESIEITTVRLLKWGEQR